MSLPTGGGAGFGIILAIAAGIITIVHKNYRQTVRRIQMHDRYLNAITTNIELGHDE